jgi:hypothetical protein
MKQLKEVMFIIIHTSAVWENHLSFNVHLSDLLLWKFMYKCDVLEDGEAG